MLDISHAAAAAAVRPSQNSPVKVRKKRPRVPAGTDPISSLCCTSYTSNSKSGGGGNNAPTLYHVAFEWRGQRCEVFRRYNDFKSLHEDLKTQYIAVSAFKFPRKSKLFTHSTSTKEQRLKAFNEYLKLLGELSPPPFELYEFLAIEVGRENGDDGAGNGGGGGGGGGGGRRGGGSGAGSGDGDGNATGGSRGGGGALDAKAASEEAAAQALVEGNRKCSFVLLSCMLQFLVNLHTLRASLANVPMISTLIYVHTMPHIINS